MDAGGRRQQKGVGMRTRKTCLQIQSKPPPRSKIKASLNKTQSLCLKQMQVSGWADTRQHGARTVTAACC